MLAVTAVLQLVPAPATRKLRNSSLSPTSQSFGLHVATSDVLPDSGQHTHDTGRPALCSKSRSKAIRQRLRQQSPTRLRNQLRCPIRLYCFLCTGYSVPDSVTVVERASLFKSPSSRASLYHTCFAKIKKERYSPERKSCVDYA